MNQPSANPERRVSWMRFTWQTVFELGITTIVTCGLLAWIAPGMGMMTFHWMLLFLLAAWIAFTVVLARALTVSAGLRLLVAIPAFFLVVEIFGWEIELLTTRLYLRPPPRPMFHNYFGEHERVLLPYWHMDMSTTDDAGTAMWADDEDNCLVAVLGAVVDGWHTGPVTGLRSSRFSVGAREADVSVEVQRTDDTLVVIRPDGEVAEFPLPPGAVRGFPVERVSRRNKDLIADVRALLDEESQARLDSFVSNGDDLKAAPSHAEEPR